MDPADVGEVEDLRQAIWSPSPRKRHQAIVNVSTLPRTEAKLDLLIEALSSHDRQVQIRAVVELVTDDRTPGHADEIVTRLSSGTGDAMAAWQLVHLGVGAGSIEHLGLRARLLPHLERLARDGRGWRIRRRARFYASELQRPPLG